MIERSETLKASIAYLNADMTPAPDKESARLVKIVYDEGGMMLLTPHKLDDEK